MKEADEVDKNSGFGFVKNGLSKPVLKQFLNIETVTYLNLCNCNLEVEWINKELPPNLESIDISFNKLVEVPNQVLKLNKLKFLNLSNNLIELFDDTPSFCQTIQTLNISNNKLIGPPYWIWTEKPPKLTHLDISNNHEITKALICGYYEELLQHTTNLINVNAGNCNLSNHLLLFGTFPNVLELDVGSPVLSYMNSTVIKSFPKHGIDKCCNTVRLNLKNTRLYEIKSNIDLFANLRNLDLSFNNIIVLPEEFCNLNNLEVCDLSCNSLLYLPDAINKLSQLKKLYLCNNDLCMLPEYFCELKTLLTLDLYNNKLYEIPETLLLVPEVDVAQNYLEEPLSEEYIEKRDKLRLNVTEERITGNKIEEVYECENNQSSNNSCDEEFSQSKHTDPEEEEEKSACSRSSSSSEDWESDSYWEPSGLRTVNRRSPKEIWMSYITKKMAEGNFCPIDLHTVPMIEQVRQQKMYINQHRKEVPGQFDDYSSDDS